MGVLEGLKGYTYFITNPINIDDLLKRESLKMITEAVTGTELFMVEEEIILSKSNFQKFLEDIVGSYRWLGEREPGTIVYVRPKYKKKDGIVIKYGVYGDPCFFGRFYDI